MYILNVYLIDLKINSLIGHSINGIWKLKDWNRGPSQKGLQLILKV